MKKKSKFSRNIITIFFILFISWILLQFLSTILLPSNTIDYLSGYTGFYDNNEKINKLFFPVNSVYYIGDIMCHQKSDRSIYINGNQMPFCSRCTSIWLGIPIGLFFLIFYSIELNNKFLFLIILGIIPLSIDGIGQLFGYWESTNIIRIFTGLFAGIVLGLAIGLIVDEIANFRYNRYENN